MTSTDVKSEQGVVLPAGRLRGLSPYEPPAPSPFVDLVLDANEGAAPSESVAGLLSGLGAEEIQRYPSTRGLERVIAGMYGVDAGRVVVTNGADDAIDRVCRAVLEPGREAVVHRPTFEMIERGVRLAGGEIRPVEWLGGAFPLGECLDAVSRETSLVALVSPNNPTGGAIPLGDMVEVARAARSAGALVLIDLAYAEFADEDPTRVLLGEPNVVVVRTLSKAMGLAGARVGYALAAPGVARWLRTVGGPYPISSASAAMAAEALRSAGERQGFIGAVRSEREKLTGLLRQLGCGVLESQANFVTARFSDASFVRDSLASLGIAVRSFASRPELDGYLRITLPGDGESFDRLLTALRTVIAPEAVLFDLDGVLADVGGSYRRAIIETARSFGVVVTPDDIAAAKRAGNANNDWDLTKRLVEERGVRCGLPEVVGRFRRFYEGTHGERGLRETERLIPDPATLRGLAERFTLGIVTGRPRDEARWFLQRAGVGGLFQTLVCMEDAPAKPSPEPVARAMEDLGVCCAWMIGDTPDDMAAARSARVLPIGVPAPGDDKTRAGDALRRAGAAAVIDGVSQIGEMIR